MYFVPMAGRSPRLCSDPGLHTHGNHEVRHTLWEWGGQDPRWHTACTRSLKSMKDNFMTQGVWNSTKEDAVADVMLADRRKLAYNVEMIGNFGTGAVSCTDLA